MADENPGKRRYRCASGEIEVSVETEEEWHALAVCIGRPELAYEGAWNAVRRAAPDGPVGRVVEEMLGEDTAGSWQQRFEAHGVPCVIR